MVISLDPAPSKPFENVRAAGAYASKGSINEP
nr:MAG TPA: hypothetical protein [Caudoviricetes sp.]